MLTRHGSSEAAACRPHSGRLSKFTGQRAGPRKLAATGGFAFILAAIAGLALSGAPGGPPRAPEAHASRLSVLTPALHAALNDATGTDPSSTAPASAAGEPQTPQTPALAGLAFAASTLTPGDGDIFSPTVEEVPVAMKRGETLVQVLTRAVGSEEDANAAIRSLRDLMNLRRLRPEQPITLSIRRPRRPHPVLDFLLSPLESAEDRRPLLVGVNIRTEVDRHVNIVRQEDGQFAGDEIVTPLTRQVVRARGTISSSLYGDARGAGIPDSVIVSMITLYAYSLDFQREIYPGDTFEVVYEHFVDEHGRPLKAGEIIFASMTNGGKERPLYRFEKRKGVVEYFDELGRSARKFLMRTPVDAVRISSRFGRRYHPIQKRWKSHNGVDFAAPTGTKIYAAGNGKVAYAGWARGYGRYIKIRHANGYETRYGHMSRLHVKRGQRVRQGQPIGRVGASGWATGPHLHYEVRIKGTPKDPLKIKGTTTLRLKGKELERFKKSLGEMKTVIASAPLLSKVKTARLGKKDKAVSVVQ
ncbi:MAG: peptidoglycan DD-metalloendopeptidase family protein [Alphaproteobacteria bacterium]